MGGFVNRERKFGLRILGMHQESSSTIHIGAEKTEALIRGIPRLDHDVIQFVTQESLLQRLRSAAPLRGNRPAHPPEPYRPASLRIERGGELTRWNIHARQSRLQANPSCRCGSVLSAQAVQMDLGFGFFVAPRIEQSAAPDVVLRSARRRAARRFQIPTPTGRVAPRKLPSGTLAVAISDCRRCASRSTPANRSCTCVC